METSSDSVRAVPAVLGDVVAGWLPGCNSGRSLYHQLSVFKGNQYQDRQDSYLHDCRIRSDHVYLCCTDGDDRWSRLCGEDSKRIITFYQFIYFMKFGIYRNLKY